MNLSGTKGRLSGVTKDLSAQWAEVKNHWRDDKAREFEHRYVSEMRIRMDKAIAIIEKLDEVVRKVQKDCE
jgi:hypothetical protein